MSSHTARNRLLAQLVAHEPQLVATATLVRLERGQLVERRGDISSHFHFPLEGLLAVEGGSVLDEATQLALVGTEGMTGIDRLLHDSFSSFSVTAIADSQVLAISASDFISAQGRNGALAKTTFAYARAFGVQLATNIAAAAHRPMRARTARWLLMASDHMGSEFTITHSQIARCLSTRRAGITTLLHGFEGEGYILSGRAQIKIIDRASLVAASDNSYGFAEAEYVRFLS